MKTFRDECEEWLKPLGYVLTNIKHGGEELSFSQLNYPIVSCTINRDGFKWCELFIGNLEIEYLISRTIIFNDPNIKLHIDRMRHYLKICKENPLI